MCRAYAGGEGGGGEAGCSGSAADEPGGAAAQAQAEELTLLVAESTAGYFGVSLDKPGQPKLYLARVWRGGKVSHVIFNTHSPFLFRGGWLQPRVSLVHPNPASAAQPACTA